MKQKQVTESSHYIQKIDVVYNPEYYELIEKYRLPVFFRSSGLGFFK
jgi:hypothetical protein